VREARRQELRRRYVKLTREYDRIFDGYSCGQTLAEQLNPRLGTIRRELDGIVVEVEEAIRGGGSDPLL